MNDNRLKPLVDFIEMTAIVFLSAVIVPCYCFDEVRNAIHLTFGTRDFVVFLLAFAIFLSLWLYIDSDFDKQAENIDKQIGEMKASAQIEQLTEQKAMLRKRNQAITVAINVMISVSVNIVYCVGHAI